MSSHQIKNPHAISRLTRNRAMSWCIDTLFVIGGITIYYLVFLGARPLAITDEQRYAEIGREMFVSGHYLIPRINTIPYFEKPDLFYWFQALGIKWFGANEWGARFWVAIFGMVGVLITYVITRKLFDRLTGLLAALMLATSLLYYTMAHIVTLDMPVSIFMTASLLCFLLAVNQPVGRGRRLLIYLSAASAAFAVLTKGLIGIIFPLMIVGVWLLLRRDWRLLARIYLPSAFLIFFLLTLPFHLYMAIHIPGWIYFYIIQQQFMRYSTDYAARYQPIWFFFVVFILGTFPWIVFLPQTLKHCWRERMATHFSTQLFLLLWIGLILIFFSFSQSKLIGYIVPVMPPFAILVANTLTTHCIQPSYRANTRIPSATTLCFSLYTLMGLMLLGTIAFPVIVYLAPMPGKLAIKPMVMITTSLAVLTLLLLGWTTFRRRYAHAIGVILLSMLLLLPCLNVVVGYFDDRSIKPMAIAIKPFLTHHTQVISYRHYYQDLPFYLERPVIVAAWEGELAFGLHHQPDTSLVIWNDQQFLSRWNQSQTLKFAIMRQDIYQALIKHYPQLTLYPLQYSRRDVLVSNRSMNL